MLPEPVRLVLADRRLSVYGVGLACCAVEMVAAAVAAEPPPAVEGPERPVEVMVVAGTVTDAMVPALLAVYEALPSPKAVLSFGACAGTGGPYWDSYVVTKGVDQVLPVDVYVPGCPPRPEALLQGLQELDALLASR